jgi:hypothetical protein
MKNVEVIHSERGAWRVPIHGMPPLSGWAVQHVSGMEPEIKEGYWLSQWQTNSARDTATFNFEPGLHMCFNEEKDAIAVSNALRENAEIETRVVKI